MYQHDRNRSQPAKENSASAPNIPETRSYRGLSLHPEHWGHYVDALPRTGGSVATGFLLQLQRRFGNRAVQRLMVSRFAAGREEVDPAVEENISEARGQGHTLDHSVQAEMESAFGENFGGVRIHTDQRADELNRSVDAVAFTTGQDIFFSEGAYAPHNTAGRSLLAHELTHVVQQKGAVQTKLEVGAPDDVYEQEADRVAKQMSADHAVAAIHRKCSCEAGQHCPECEEEKRRAHSG